MRVTGGGFLLIQLVSVVVFDDGIHALTTTYTHDLSKCALILAMCYVKVLQKLAGALSRSVAMAGGATVGP